MVLAEQVKAIREVWKQPARQPDRPYGVIRICGRGPEPYGSPSDFNGKDHRVIDYERQDPTHDAQQQGRGVVPAGSGRRIFTRRALWCFNLPGIP